MAGRALSYVVTLEDATEGALHSLESSLAKLHGGFLDIPLAAAGAAAGVIGVGVAAEKITEKLLEAAKEAVMLGIEWQHESSSLAAATDLSIAKAREMGDAFLKLGSEVPQSGTEITQAYEKVAGRMELFTGEAQSAAEATLLMKTAAEGAVAGNQSLDASTAALVQQMLASHAAIEDQEHVMDVLFNTSRLTGASYEGLSTIMGRLQARMGESAPPIQDVGLAVALMGEAGLTGARAMMVVNQMLTALSDPSETARGDLEGLGVEIQKNADGSLNLRGTLEELTAAFARIEDPVTRHALAVELVGKEYAGVFESAIRSAAGNLDSLAEKIGKSNSAHEAAEKHADDLGERFEKLRNQSHAMAQVLGESVADTLVHVADTFDTVGQSAAVALRDFEAWQRRNAQASTGGVDALQQAGFAHLADDLEQELQRAAAAGDVWARSEATRLEQMKADHHRWTMAEIDDLKLLMEERRKLFEDAAKGTGSRAPTVNQDDLIAQALAGAGLNRAGNPLPPPIDPDALRANVDLLSSLGTEGEKLHQTMLRISQENLAGGLQEGLRELMTEEAKQEEAFRRAFDPAHPEQAAQRIATLRSLTDEYTASAIKAQQTGEASDIAARNAAQAALDTFNLRIQGAERLQSQNEKTEAFNRQQEAAERQRAAEEKRLEDERLRAIHEMAITGFDEGTQRNELIQHWGKLGSDSIVALTEALSDPAHMRSAGTALSNSIAQLTEHLHEAGVADWAETGKALTDAFRLAIEDGTPENVQAAQDLLSQTVQVLSDTEMWAEWEKAAKVAGDKVNAATIDTAEKIEEAWTQHDQRMRDLDDRFGEKSRVDRARTLVDQLTADLKGQLDQQQTNQRQADQDIIESMRLVDQQRDSSVNQARQAADAETSRLRSTRDAGIQTSRALADAESEHEQRLADIAAKGGPDVGTQTAAENENFRRQQQRFDLQQRRAEDDRRRAEADAAVDVATRITREQADRSRHETDALALKAKEHELATQEQTTALANAQVLKDEKQRLEEQYHIDKGTLEDADKARQIQNIDDVARHAEEVANRQLGKTRGSADQDLQNALDVLDKKFPGARATIEGLGLVPAQAPPALPDVKLILQDWFQTNFPKGTGTPFNPQNPLDQTVAAETRGRNLTIGQIYIDNHGFMGDGAPAQIAEEVVAAEEAAMQQ